MDANQFKDRINMLSEKVGGTSALARLAGVSESVVRKWKLGDSEPTVSRLLALADAGQVSVNWLLTGKGQPNDQQESPHVKAVLEEPNAESLRTQAYANWKIAVNDSNTLVEQSFNQVGLKVNKHWKDMMSAIVDKYQIDSQDIDDLVSLIRTEADISSEFALIPGYRVEVSAGHGASPLDEEPTRYLAFRHKWLQYRRLKADNLVLVFARGDSMEPTIQDNNTVMIDTNQRDLVDGNIYVIRTDNHLVVKRVQKLINKGILLLSDNKEYKEQRLESSETQDLEVIGRVVWIGKDV